MFFNTSVFLSYLLQFPVSQRLNNMLRFLPFSAPNRGMAKSMRVLRASNGRENMKNVYNNEDDRQLLLFNNDVWRVRWMLGPESCNVIHTAYMRILMLWAFSLYLTANA